MGDCRVVRAYESVIEYESCLSVYPEVLTASVRSTEKVWLSWERQRHERVMKFSVREGGAAIKCESAPEIIICSNTAPVTHHLSRIVKST